MLVSYALFGCSQVLLNLGCQQVVPMAILVNVLLFWCGVGLSNFGWELEEQLLPLENFLPAREFDAAVGTFSENVERTVEDVDCGHKFLIDDLLKSEPIYVLVIFQNLELKCLLYHFVSDSCLFELLQQCSCYSLEGSWAIKHIHFPPDFCQLRVLAFEQRHWFLLYLNLVDYFAVDTNHSHLDKPINYSHKVFNCQVIQTTEINDF